MKIRPVTAELFHSDGQTEKPNSHFSQFLGTAPKYVMNITALSRMSFFDLAQIAALFDASYTPALFFIPLKARLLEDMLQPDWSIQVHLSPARNVLMLSATSIIRRLLYGT